MASEPGAEGPAPNAVDSEELESVLLPDGALVFDAAGQVRYGLGRIAFEGLGVGDPPLWRMAVAELAARHLGGEASKKAAPQEPVPVESLPGQEGRCIRLGDDEVELLVAPGYLDDGLLRSALDLRASARACLPVVEWGSRVCVGPVLLPAGGPCIACVRAAVAPNRPVETVAATGRGPRLHGERVREIVSGLAPDHLWALAGIVEVSPEGEVADYHHVRRFPDCPLCGVPRPGRAEGPPRLRPRTKHPDSDTGSRTAAPDEVYRRFRHLISPLSGAVRHLTEIHTGAPGLVHVYTAAHATQMRLARVEEFLRDGRDRSGGKGSTAAQARVSAMCEALERFSSVYRGTEVSHVGSLRDTSEAVHPNESMLFSERQYRDREAWNAAETGRFHRVPEPFDPDAEVAWSPVWHPGSGERRYLPTGFLHFGFRGPGSEFCTADSNGMAAGLGLEEAVLQGLLELVERDAVAIWWYNRTRQPEVDVGSFRDSYVDDVFWYYADLGRETWVLDLTTDLGIPVFAALSARRPPGPEEVIFGFGAHPDPSVALRRCVTEMNQLLATVSRPPEERRTVLEGEFDGALRWWSEEGLDGNAYLLPDSARSTRAKTDYGYDWSDDVLADLESCMNLVGERGLDIFVRDMTRDDIGLSVVKVVVPGLRHFWRRFAPGRLYDVPFDLGRVSRPRTEAELNPIPLFV